MPTVDKSKKIIIKQGRVEENDCAKLCRAYNEVRPKDIPLTHSIAPEVQENPAEPGVVDQITDTLAHLATGAVAGQIGGIAGVAAAGAAFSLYDLTKCGLRVIDEYFHGDPKNDLALEGLSYPDEFYDFPDNETLKKELGDAQIANLKKAHFNLCQYIKSKIQRDFWTKGKIFNKDEVSDPKLLAPIFLAHKIESIFKSYNTKVKECEYNYRHFVNAVKDFMHNAAVTKTNSTDTIFLSLQTILMKISSDFDGNFKFDTSLKIKTERFIYTLNQFKLKSTKNLLETETRLHDLSQKIKLDANPYLEQLNKIKDTISALQTDSLNVKTLLANVKKIRLQIRSFLKKSEEYFASIYQNYNNANGPTRTEILLQVGNRDKLLKEELKNLSELEEMLVELDVLIPDTNDQAVQNQSPSQEPVEENMSDEDLLKSFVEIKDNNDDLFASFVMLESQRIDYQISSEVAKLIAERAQEEVSSTGKPQEPTSTANQATVAPTKKWGLIGQLINYLPFRDSNPTRITNLQTQIKLLTDENTKLKNSLVIASANLQQLSNDVTKLSNQNTILNSKHTKALRTQQEKQNIIDAFEAWIITDGYADKNNSFAFFSTHRHGREGIDRALKLVKAFKQHFANINITLDEFKSFIRLQMNNLQGNYFKYSLKTYLLTFVTLLNPNQDILLNNNTNTDIDQGILQKMSANVNDQHRQQVGLLSKNNNGLDIQFCDVFELKLKDNSDNKAKAETVRNFRFTPY